MLQTSDTAADQIPAGKSREWNWHPALPISMSPVFDVPPQPAAAARWLIGTWTKLSPPVSHMIFATLAYLFLWPSMTQMQDLQVSWVLQIYGINMGAAVLLGTSLHLYL
ncbi:hypothetical protein [Sulfitobacter sp. S190]|uniref:hypothetical protein n=1 Tax=Sulfitobacter sp. S190 TaxID=2867022 RepID=UPI0021A48882|nr:hypothetical protein [Sulfitobacter sp. S190]UWR23022.1 hypothetical protein K3756_03210 [Sulfitobacter sp. S190]